jgi:hypothetical protein
VLEKKEVKRRRLTYFAENGWFNTLPLNYQGGHIPQWTSLAACLANFREFIYCEGE